MPKVAKPPTNRAQRAARWALLPGSMGAGSASRAVAHDPDIGGKRAGMADMAKC
jgi:hypothetical protein